MFSQKSDFLESVGIVLSHIVSSDVKFAEKHFHVTTGNGLAQTRFFCKMKAANLKWEEKQTFVDIYEQQNVFILLQQILRTSSDFW